MRHFSNASVLRSTCPRIILIIFEIINYFAGVKIFSFYLPLLVSIPSLVRSVRPYVSGSILSDYQPFKIVNVYVFAGNLRD